jgi:hypothetical protein
MPGLSFSDLVELGIDHIVADCFQQARSYLDQALAAAPTSADAGLAANLRLWAFIEQNKDSADLLSAAAPVVQAEVARICTTYSEPQTQAFAQLQSQTFDAWRAGDRETFASLCQQAADTWRGTYLGSWAQLRVGYLYWVDGKWDFDRAEQAFLKAAHDYAGTPVEAEALEYLAQSTRNRKAEGWIEEVQQLCEQALRANPSARTHARILSIQAGLVAAADGPAEAMPLYADIIARYPSSASAYWAGAEYMGLALRLGLWEEAAADAAALLGVPGGDPEVTCDAHLTLGDQAFRKGQLDAAESEFALALEWAQAKPPGTGGAIQELGRRAMVGLANCRSAQGDLQGAISYFLQAAEAAGDGPGSKKALYLYGAAVAADQLGDAATVNQIAAQLVAECPGSAYTTRIVGGEVLPPAEP